MENNDEFVEQLVRILKKFPAEVRRKEKVAREVEKIKKKFAKGLESVIAEQQRHPWRICPLGQHWVAPCRSVSISGKAFTVNGFCRNNRSKHDQLYADEIVEIGREHIKKLTLPNDFYMGDWGFRVQQDWNRIIFGWTKYWNEVLRPNDPLDPNLVKALIASESSFINHSVRRINGGRDRVRGLMQMTDSSVKVLRDGRGEIKGHYINIDLDDLMEPEISICAGIRWLFHKRKLTESKEGAEVTWDRVVEYYKGLAKRPKAERDRVMESFREKYGDTLKSKE